MYKSLIIDDEKPVHRVINALGQWFALGISAPASAYDGHRGLCAMRELRPDIVFLDMQMPLLNGVDFLKAAVPEFSKTKFIVVSGYDQFTYTKIAIQYHVLDYLLKPIVEGELNSAMEKARNLLDAENNTVRKNIPEISDVSTEMLAQAVKDYLDKNYSKEVHLTELADRFHFSKEYISKLFKGRYGTGIYEYVLNLRMARAKELLLDENLQVQAISERLGYKDNNYFSKAFRTFYGFSPSEFKERQEHCGIV